MSTSDNKEHPQDQGDLRDINSVDGRVENGGIVIQGRDSHVEIHQHFNDSLSKPKSSHSTEAIDLLFFEPETILIPEGLFWMGSPPGVGIPEYETPLHSVFLPAYRIGKYPITNQQFAVFARQMKISIPIQMGWDGQMIPQGKENYPVIGVTWFETIAYCRWLSERTGREYSLPTEAQWEKACKGSGNAIFPWGNEFDSQRCNHGQASIAPVNKYREQNDYGCYDLVGNIRQWTCTLWGTEREHPNPKFAYPWPEYEDGRNNLDETDQIWRVLRGSTFRDEPGLLRCSMRSGQLPENRGFPGSRYGFRVVMKVK